MSDSGQLGLVYNLPTRVTLSQARLDEIRRDAEASRGERAKRLAARRLVGREIELGRIKRLPCEACGYLDVHAHHDDYDKPREVRWLCEAHHLEAHGKRLRA